MPCSTLPSLLQPPTYTKQPHTRAQHHVYIKQQQPRHAACRGAAVDEQPTTSTSGAHHHNGTTHHATHTSHTPPVRGAHGALVEVQDITKRFETRQGVYMAVDNLSLTIEANKLTALLGPSGSGKTTLLRMIAGLESPTSGRVLLDGVDMTDASIKDRNIGMVFQNYALFKHMSVADNIAFGPRMRKLDIDIEQRVTDLLDLVELPHVANRLPSQLSGGQRQRIALARALASDPKILLLDEPFGALDPVVRYNLRQELKSIVERAGVTTIMVTHDQEEALDIADNLVLFNKGRVEQVGATEAVFGNPASPFVMSFLGDTNNVPNGCQLMKKMGFATSAPYVMFRPSRVQMSKELELHVLREEDDEIYGDIDTLDRVFIRVAPEDCMGYHPRDIDQSVLDLV